MATTALKITKADGINRLLFMTVQKDSGIDVDLSLADENFMPIGRTSLGISAIYKDEESYHKSLREHAHQKGQFVSDFSTNPEWNPGVGESSQLLDEENGQFQGDLYQ